jgi:IPT/TIG domain
VSTPVCTLKAQDSVACTFFGCSRYFTLPGARMFNMDVEGNVFQNIDLVEIGGSMTAFTLEVAQVVDDGAVSIAFTNRIPKVDNPKVSGIEIKLLSGHLAHAVAGGPYDTVDTSNQGTVSLLVDGSASHTHGTGLALTQWIWKIGSTIVARGETSILRLPVGEYMITLTVIDSGENESAETTTVSIYPFGYPSITSIYPISGTIAGNEEVTIYGSGFTFSPEETTVHFGLTPLTGSSISIVDATKIKVKSPRAVVGTPVSVRVQTPLHTSNTATFTYIASSKIEFISNKLTNIGSAVTATFGPDGKLYVGTLYGQLFKLTLNDDFSAVVRKTAVTVANFRAILGIAFDPMDSGHPNPPVYCTSSYFFHGDPTSSSGQSINGKIHRVSGANLTIIEAIITGLPVSDHDHGTYSFNLAFVRHVGSHRSILQR